MKWYGFLGHIQSPHHAHNARNETASLRRAFAFHPEEGTGQRVGSFRWFDPRLGYLCSMVSSIRSYAERSYSKAPSITGSSIPLLVTAMLLSSLALDRPHCSKRPVTQSLDFPSSCAPSIGRGKNGTILARSFINAKFVEKCFTQDAFSNFS